MNITGKEVENRLYPNRDRERMGSRNVFLDLLEEAADAVGFKMLWLKEDYSKDKPYVFDESDLDSISEMIDSLKGENGRRLRKKNYRNTPGWYIDEVIEFFMSLAIQNGVDDADLWEQWLGMLVTTDCEVIRDGIREMTDEFEYDIVNNFFVVPWNAKDGVQDDHIPPVARLVFLEFILGNIDMPLEDIRGTYWFFRCKYEEDQYQDFRACGEYLRGLTDDQMRQYQAYIWNYLQCESAVDADKELAEKIDFWLDVEDGNGRLQDIKRQKQLLKIICERRNQIAEKFFCSGDGRVNMPKQNETVETLSAQYDTAYQRIFTALYEYRNFHEYRLNNPVAEDDKTMLEIGFERRFGEVMVKGENLKSKENQMPNS